MIKRRLFEEVKAHLEKEEMSLVAGPRQAGKTTLLMWLKEYLEKRGEKTVFFNLDIEEDKQFFVSQEKLIKKIQLELGKVKGYVFIDEIQRREDAGVFLKGIFDMKLPLKFIISGSGSVELKEKIHESLVGRKRIFEMNTISLEELVNFRTNYKYENNLSGFFEVEKEKTKELLSEYLNFGGYPKVILEEKLEEKRKIISEIYQSYLEKDIAYLLAVKNTEVFTKLVKIMAAQTGNLVNFSELSSILGISSQTVKNYLWYLEKTFVLRRVNPYFRNVRKEVTKMPVFYFYDLGFRNYALGDFRNDLPSQNLGFVFENFIFNSLSEKAQEVAAGVNFWRTKDGAEVDFVVDFKKEIVPVEAKYRSLSKPELTRSLKNFIIKYKPRKAYVVNLELEEKVVLGKTNVEFIRFTDLGKIFTLYQAPSPKLDKSAQMVYF